MKGPFGFGFNKGKNNIPSLVNDDDPENPLQDLLDEAFIFLDADDVPGADGSSPTTIINKNGGDNWSLDGIILEVNQVNGHNALREQATFTGMRGPNDLLVGKTELTVVYVGIITGVNGAAGFVRWGTSSDSNHYPYTNNAIYICIGSTIRRDLGHYITFQMNAWHSAVYRARNGYWNLRTNGIERVNEAVNTFGVPSGQPFFLSGNEMMMGMLLVWDRTLLDGECELIEDYLETLYAL